jgi:hypothetical protein
MDLPTPQPIFPKKKNCVGIPVGPSWEPYLLGSPLSLSPARLLRRTSFLIVVPPPLSLSCGKSKGGVAPQLPLPSHVAVAMANASLHAARDGWICGAVIGESTLASTKQRKMPPHNPSVAAARPASSTEAFECSMHSPWLCSNTLFVLGTHNACGFGLKFELQIQNLRI